MGMNGGNGYIYEFLCSSEKEAMTTVPGGKEKKHMDKSAGVTAAFS